MSATGDTQQHDWLGHPRGLAILFTTEMWERFCYYGMRALLTYYMVDYLFVGDRPESVIGYATIKSALEALFGPLAPQPLASLIYGTYTSGTYLLGVGGGALADRVLGQRRAVLLGALIMAAGEFLLMAPQFFLIGLPLLVFGNGLFKPNIAIQVGGLYRPGDARIDRAYSIFYLGINLGALIAPPICGRLGHAAAGAPPSWAWGFGAAGIGMLLSFVIYLVGGRTLPPDTRARRLAGANAHAPLTGVDRRVVAALCAIAVCTLFFWAGYEQQGITLALMAQDHARLGAGLFTLAPEDVQSFSPFFILTLTPLVLALWARQGRAGREPSPVAKMALGCLAMSLSFVLLLVPAGAVDAGRSVSWLWLFAAIGLQTAGELYVQPVSLSLVGRVAPPKVASLMMGISYCALAAGNYLAGYLGHFWSGMAKTEYFLMMAGITGVAGGLIAALIPVLRPVLSKREDVLF